MANRESTGESGAVEGHYRFQFVTILIPSRRASELVNETQAPIPKS